MPGALDDRLTQSADTTFGTARFEHDERRRLRQSIVCTRIRCDLKSGLEREGGGSEHRRDYAPVEGFDQAEVGASGRAPEVDAGQHRKCRRCRGVGLDSLREGESEVQVAVIFAEHYLHLVASDDPEQAEALAGRKVLALAERRAAARRFEAERARDAIAELDQPADPAGARPE